MKRSFFRTHRARNRLMTAGGFRVGAAALVLVFGVLGIRAFLPGALTFLATPLWRAGASLTASVEHAGATFKSKGSVEAERERMLAENAALVAENTRLTAQAADLTRLIGTRTEGTHGLLAAVLARPPLSPYDVIIVDQGENAGAKVGMLALGPGGVPVGTVASIAPGSSRVLLFSSPGRETLAWAGESRTALTLTGQGSGAFTAEVPREAPVAAGDLVYAAGPGSLPIGTVTNVASDPAATEAKVIIRPFVSPFSLTWVELSSVYSL